MMQNELLNGDIYDDFKMKTPFGFHSSYKNRYTHRGHMTSRRALSVQWCYVMGSGRPTRPYYTRSFLGHSYIITYIHDYQRDAIPDKYKIPYVGEKLI